MPVCTAMKVVSASPAPEHQPVRLGGGGHEGVALGVKVLKLAGAGGAPNVQLLASGALLQEALAAAETLASEFGVSAEVFSVTSWSELARDGMVCERAARLTDATQPAHVHRLLAQHGSCAPIIAVSDYVRAVPDSIRAFVPADRPFVTLGTDGFGRSDTRAALRAFFEVDASTIVHAALHALRTQGRIGDEPLARARARIPGGEPPWQR